MKNMKLFYSTLCFTLAFCFNASAQTFTSYSIPTSHIYKNNTLENNGVNIVNIEAPYPGGSDKKRFLDSLKKINVIKYKTTSEAVVIPTKKTAPDLAQGISIDANYGGTPNDNSLAISNNDILISAVNSSLFYYNSISQEYLGKDNLTSLCNCIKSNVFDPKVIYDPIQDKFIFVFLKESSAAQNKIFVGFSITNNPRDGWNIYTIEGNPNNTNQWSDYPAISITDDELFITVNLLEENTSWQTGFQETIIWQINKDDGYNNLALNTLLWKDIKENNLNIRNLHPVRNYNHFIANNPVNNISITNQYFLSNRNFATESDSIYLVEIDNTISNAPNMNITLLQSANKYYLSPNADQSNGFQLATNDSRVLGGIINRGIDQIQFVNNSMDISNGNCGVYHGFIDNITNSPTCFGNIISDPILDLGYPNIASTSRDFANNEVIIGFNHTSEQDFPGTSAIYYDNNDSYSNIIKLSEGIEDLISINRWGDYSGIQRKYNQPETVWFSGTYSKYNASNIISRGTWVSQLITANFVSVNEENKSSFSIYPNPTSNFVFLEFELSQSEHISIDLYDNSGKLIKHLHQEECLKGLNKLEFNTTNLKKGSYLIKITNDSESLVKSHFFIKN